MKNLELDIQQLEVMISKGFIMKNKHPKLDLWIYNYTQTTQYEREWNQYTQMCRGIIMDANHKMIARPFPKFFNIEEHAPNDIPNLPFEVYEKLDGSLGVLFWVDNKPFISTRNSFNSKQAIKANALLHTKYQSCLAHLNTDKTYVFEIIYPENRIVVNYGAEEKLVLLAIIDTKTGQEDQLVDIGFPLPKIIKGIHNFKDLKALNWHNQEGFVLRYDNGFRVKIKFENYVKLHRIVTQVSSISIWEQLKSEQSLHGWIQNVPDEFYVWVKKIESELLEMYNKIEREAKAEYRVLNTKKETALYFKTCQHQSILFAMLNQKPYSKIIWKKIKPKFEKAYTDQIN